MLPAPDMGVSSGRVDTASLFGKECWIAFREKLLGLVLETVRKSWRKTQIKKDYVFRMKLHYSFFSKIKNKLCLMLGDIKNVRRVCFGAIRCVQRVRATLALRFGKY